METKESPVKAGTYLTTDGELKPIQWKTPFNHDTNAESDKYALTCLDKTLTQQHFKEECDINYILERYRAAQQIPPLALPEHFLDLSERMTFVDIQTRLAEANANFYRLPPEIREEHLNSPARWADQVIQATDAGDRAKLRKLGIDAPEPVQEDAETPTPPVVTPAAGPAKGTSEAPKNAPTGAKD